MQFLKKYDRKCLISNFFLVVMIVNLNGLLSHEFWQDSSRMFCMFFVWMFSLLFVCFVLCRCHRFLLEKHLQSGLILEINPNISPYFQAPGILKYITPFRHLFLPYPGTWYQGPWMENLSSGTSPPATKPRLFPSSRHGSCPAPSHLPATSWVGDLFFFAYISEDSEKKIVENSVKFLFAKISEDSLKCLQTKIWLSFRKKKKLHNLQKCIVGG